ncbi:MAG: mechanosensitive ion channel [Bacteroidales bacterium]
MLSIDPSVKLRDIFIDAGLSFSLSSVLSTLTLVFIITMASWLANMLTKLIIRKVVARLVKKSKSQWDDIFFEQKVFTRLSHFAPALIIQFTSVWALQNYTFWLKLVHNLNYIYMLCIGMIVILSFIEAWHQIYQTLPISKHRNIKGYVQLVKILVILIVLLIIVSVVFKKDISTIIAGLSAMAAVLILVFKDTLLGFVGSIQLSANKMLKVGDWITMPARDVDGTVSDITLNTVKVQNFDKTIITIPTYALVSESFQNWIGMEESGIRQIKRAIFVDMKSVRFIDKELKARLSSSEVLGSFIGEMEQKSKMTDATPLFDVYRLTNLGLFRYYAEEYLRRHPLIDGENTIMVRHRAPEGNGLPLQVYAFTKNNSFVPYEHIQSEVFEHLLAIIREFDLRVFQQPTGEDILELTSITNKK